jgi:alkylation response protein AidB-like acyl-CoA dehydrogenase
MTASPEARPVREVVRAAIAAWSGLSSPQCDAWLFGHDPEFTRLLAERGLIGITWPEEFGGRAGSALDRLVVTEELLRAGAPVAAHWVADRQIGPAILRYGDRELQQEFLPRIAAGQVTFCLGMSEPESGSDLAAVRTRAVPVEGGYRITGHKLWTSNAHRSTHAYVLARVPGGVGKHDGLTEFIVDLDAPGIEVRPIYDLNREHHFNETVFTDVFVPAGRVIGREGHGWHQVTEQLSFERGGIERVLSTYPVLDRLLREGRLHAEHQVQAGQLAARLHALRGLASGVAAAVDAGEAPVRPAAMLKYLGTSFEGQLVEFGRVVLGSSPRPGRSAADRLVAQGILRSPGATLRGGTTEVLLNILARHAGSRPAGDELAQLADEALADLDRADKAASTDEVWARVSSLGWTAVGVPEPAGGSGGDVADLATIVRGLGRRALAAPVAETALANAALARGPAACAGQDMTRPRTLATRTSLRLHRDRSQLVLTGRCDLVPWAPFAAEAVVAARDEDQRQVLVRLDLAAPGVRCQPFADLAGDPTADLEMTACPVAADDVLGGADLVRWLEAGQRALRSAAALGAMEYATRLAAEHADVRTQFGRPLRSFQAVAHHLARMEAELALSGASLRLALEELLRGGPGRRALAAQVQVAHSSGLVARTAHQVLGAMGMTREHPLHRATVRLWSWQDAPVAAAELARELGRAVTAAGPDGFWEWLVTSTDDLDREAGR